MTFIEQSFYALHDTEYTRVVYSEWGPKNGDPVICVHGLTGNGQEFDIIAEHLSSQGYRVLAIDLPGRHRSDDLKNPDGYAYSFYVQILNNLLIHAGIDRPNSVHWIGTSLGGLLGMRMAGIENSPIKSLILNDIGPHVPEEDLRMIDTYLAYSYEFDTLEQYKTFMIEGKKPNYGPMKDEHWDQMLSYCARKLPNGKITSTYDPEIKHVFAKEPIGEYPLWPYWDRITCPTLILRGGKSTLFPQSVADEMMVRGPGKENLCTFIRWDECGHVPSLMDEGQIQTIDTWLTEIQKA